MPPYDTLATLGGQFLALSCGHPSGQNDGLQASCSPGGSQQASEQTRSEGTRETGVVQPVDPGAGALQEARGVWSLALVILGLTHLCPGPSTQHTKTPYRRVKPLNESGPVLFFLFRLLVMSECVWCDGGREATGVGVCVWYDGGSEAADVGVCTHCPRCAFP